MASANAVLWLEDRKVHHKEVALNDVLKTATGASKKHPFSLIVDFRKLAKGPGKMTFPEYVDYRLYDRTLFPDDNARLRFLSDKIQWSLCYQCSPREWNAATDDKWISESLLKDSGIRTTQTLAVIGGEPRQYGRTPHLSSLDSFAAFLADQKLPLYAKINGGIASEGLTRIVPLGDGKFDVVGMGAVGADVLFRCLSDSPGAYLLQEELLHHDQMTALCGPRIATIRAISFVIKGEVHTPYTLLKMPAGNNVADNLWREGNMIADLNRDTGEIMRVVRGKGPDTELLEHHPDTGARLLGSKLPDWQAVKQLVHDTALLYAPVKYQSLDIALTNNGPTIVEVNTGSSFTLSQIAKGEGFLSDEVIDLFKRAGAKIDTSKI